jgi:hypothetical protein
MRIDETRLEIFRSVLAEYGLNIRGPGYTLGEYYKGEILHHKHGGLACVLCRAGIVGDAKFKVEE